MRELDEKALTKAAHVVGMELFLPYANPATVARAVVTAYLSAARPTLDADAMGREFVGKLSGYRRACEVGVIRALRGNPIGDADPEPLEHQLLGLFRKAVSR